VEHDERKRLRTRDDWESKPRDMPRLPGESVERGEDDDGVVHEMSCIASMYAFRCRATVRVYVHDEVEYDNEMFFTHPQALTLKTSRPVNCILCLTSE